jgi:cellulose biosynthesis protein BcsQ
LKIIALYSIKGGVGKTAASANLAYIASSQGHSTLLFDLDPQGSSTFYFRIRAPKKLKRKVLFQNKKRIDQFIRGSDFEKLDLLPAHLSYRKLDIALDDLRKPKKRFQQVFDDYQKEYDFIFIDCPPNITLVAENVFNAADHILVPFIPTTLSFTTYEKLIGFFKRKNLDRSKILVFFSMVEKRKKLHQEMIQKMSKKRSHFLTTQIPYSSVVEKMGIHRKPVPCFEKRSAASRAYVQLWLEIEEAIKED